LYFVPQSTYTATPAAPAAAPEKHDASLAVIHSDMPAPSVAGLIAMNA